MLQHDIVACPRHLLIAVVVGIVADKRERISLIHPHVSEGLKGVAGIVEIGTVTVEPCPLMGEVHLTVKNCRIGIDSVIVVEHIGMNEIDTSVLNLRLTGRTPGLTFAFLGSSRTQSGQQGHNQQK